MTPADLTAFLSAAGSLVGMVIIPPAISRRKEKRERAGEDTTAAAARAATTEVTWEAINQAIKQDNDSLRAQLKEQKQAHHTEMTELRRQLRYCQAEVDRLHRDYSPRPPRIPDE